MPKLSIDFEAKFASVLDGLDQIKRESAKTAKEMESAFSGLKGILSGALAAGALNEFRDSFLKTVETLASFKEGAEKAGTSIENFSALFYDLRDSAIPVQALTDATGKLVKTMQEAESPTSDAADAFKKMGVSVKDSNGNLRDATEVFRDISEKFAGYADGANKVALAQVLFGKSGADLLPVLKDLAETGRQNAGISADQATAADDFQKSINRLNGELERGRIAFFGGYIDPMTELITKFVDGKKAGLDFFDQLDRLQLQAANKTRAFFGADHLDEVKQLEEQRDSLKGQIDRLRATPTNNIGQESGLRRAVNDLAEVETKLQAIQKLAATDLERSLAKFSKEAMIASGNVEPLDQAPIARRLDSGTGREVKAKLDAGQRIIDQLEKQLATEFDLTSYEKFHVELRQQINKAIAEGNDAEALSLAAITEQGGALASLIDQHHAREKAQKRESEEAERQLQSLIRLGEKNQALVKSYQDLIDPAEKYREKLREITDLEQKGLLNSTESKMARDIITDQISSLDKDLAKAKDIDDTAAKLGLTFTSAFEDAVVGGKNFRGVLDGIYKDILRIAARKLLTEALTQSIKGLQDLFGGEGGMVVNGGSGGTNNTGTNLRLFEGPQYDTSGLVGAAGVQQNIIINGSGATMADVAKAVRLGNAQLQSEAFDQQRRGGSFG